MVHGQIRRQNSGLPKMEAVERFGSIPLVETGLKTAENAYAKIKGSNRLINWYLDTAEATLFVAIESVRPAVKLLENPLRRLDQIMCKSLDVVEQRIPQVYLPPELMYWNTKEYMSDHLVRPVLKRADSMKQLGNAVLDSRVTNYAADRIDGAITVADTYVDKYLPEDSQDQNEVSPTESDKEKGAIKAIHHGQRFSRKLKRRLTQRTIAEARALKKQSTEAIHVLIYAAELIATDPKLALQKAQELWSYLSKDEPENQERPETLEQLMVLLTRESARRIVHLVNYTSLVASRVPKSLVASTRELAHQFIYITSSLAKLVHLESAKTKVVEETGGIVARVTKKYEEIQAYTNYALESLAVFLSGRIEPEKITTTNPRRRVVNSRRHNNPMQNNINGVY